MTENMDFSRRTDWTAAKAAFRIVFSDNISKPNL